MADSLEQDRSLLRLAGELFAAVTILETLPSVRKKLEFTRRALAGVPGMPLKSICVREGVDPALSPDRLHPDCAKCLASRADSRLDVYDCLLPPDMDGLHVYPLGTANLFLGHILFTKAKAADVAFIEPLILNFITALAVSIENELQQNAICKSKQTLHALLDAADDAIILIDAAGVIQSINMTAATRLGGVPEKLVGTRYFERIPPETAACRKRMTADVFRTGRPVRVSEEKDGAYFDTTVYPIFDARNALSGYAIFSTDVTDRRQSENALRYHGEFKTLILDISARFINLPPDAMDAGIETALAEIAGFIGVDSGYLFRFSEDLKTFGVTHLWRNDMLRSRKEDLAGLDVRSMPWWMDRLMAGKPVVASSVDDLPEDAAVEKSVIKPQGINSLADVPLFYRNRIIGFLGFASTVKRREWTDDEISLFLVAGRIIVNALQRTSAEMELRQAHERLEQKVRERTEALESKARQLEAANQELDQFAYVASHDLKAPLRAIHNYSDFLREDLEDVLEDEQRTYLDNLGRAVRQGEELVNDLLALSRLGRLNEQEQTLNLGDLVRDVLKDAGFDDGVQVALPADWPEMTAPPTLIRLIFQNLISNAVKFNRAPEKRVDIGWRPSGGDGVCAWVTDNGIGIDPRFHEQIFKLFQRLHTRKDYEGSGLGLAIVKKAVALLGGSAAVTSAPDRGSTFTVVLPNVNLKTRKTP